MTADARSYRVTAVLLLLMLIGVTACNNGSAGEGTAQPANGGAQMQQGVMIYDEAMKQRHTEEADALVSEARAHIASMRMVGAVQWSKRTGAHADIVDRITRTVDRQMRERDMNMNRADERNGEAMGISGPEYRRMREQLRALRAEAQALESAADADLQTRMAPHLEQLAAFVEMVAKSAQHMRGAVLTSHQ